MWQWRRTVRGNYSYAMPHTLGSIVAPSGAKGVLLKRGKVHLPPKCTTTSNKVFFPVLLTISSLDVMHHNFTRPRHCIQDMKLLSRWKPSTLPPSYCTHGYKQPSHSNPLKPTCLHSVRAHIAPQTTTESLKTKSALQTITTIVCKRRVFFSHYSTQS
jgi:hypothetical protein